MGNLWTLLLWIQRDLGDYGIHVNKETEKTFKTVEIQNTLDKFDTK